MNGVRFVLPVAPAGGPALSDSDVDQRAVGGSGAGWALCPCKVPHIVCLEVGLKNSAVCSFLFGFASYDFILFFLQSTGAG